MVNRCCNITAGGDYQILETIPTEENEEYYCHAEVENPGSARPSPGYLPDLARPSAEIPTGMENPTDLAKSSNLENPTKRDRYSTESPTESAGPFHLDDPTAVLIQFEPESPNASAGTPMEHLELQRQSVESSAEFVATSLSGNPGTFESHNEVEKPREVIDFYFSL